LVSNSSLLSDQQILPQFRVKKAVDSQGMSLVLQHNGEHVRESTFEDLDLPDDVDFIGHDQPLQLDVFCVGYEGSPALRWKYAPTGDDDDPFDAPVVDSGILSGLDGPLRIVRVSTEVVMNPSPDARPFSNMLIQSADPNAPVHMCGLRWRRAHDPGGIAVTPISEGGYRSFSYLRNHSEAGPMLDAAGPWQAVMFQFGTNDAGAELAPSTFRRNTLDLIEALRSEAWLNDPDLLVLLVSEYPRTGPEAELAILDAQPGVLASICDEDDRCVLLHARRFVDDAGWAPETAMTYLHDGTHPNALGARTMARAVTDALRHAAGLLPQGDVDGSGAVDMRDLAAVLFSVGRRASPDGPQPAADVNGDGVVDSRDVRVVLKRLR